MACLAEALHGGLPAALNQVSKALPQTFCRSVWRISMKRKPFRPFFADTGSSSFARLLMRVELFGSPRSQEP